MALTAGELIGNILSTGADENVSDNTRLGITRSQMYDLKRCRNFPGEPRLRAKGDGKNGISLINLLRERPGWKTYGEDFTRIRNDGNRLPSARNLGAALRNVTLSIYPSISECAADIGYSRAYLNNIYKGDQDVTKQSFMMPVEGAAYKSRMAVMLARLQAMSDPGDKARALGHFSEFLCYFKNIRDYGKGPTTPYTDDHEMMVPLHAPWRAAMGEVFTRILAYHGDEPADALREDDKSCGRDSLLKVFPAMCKGTHPVLDDYRKTARALATSYLLTESHPAALMGDRYDAADPECYDWPKKKDGPYTRAHYRLMVYALGRLAPELGKMVRPR